MGSDKKKNEIRTTLKGVTGDQYQIFLAAEAKLAREERRKFVESNYYHMCVEAKMCPVCGSENATIKDHMEFHEKMMEDEYEYTKITCLTCGRLIKVYIENREY